MRASATRIAFVTLLILAVSAGIIMPALAQVGRVQETVLPNGLKVLTKEVHAAPVVSFNVWYRVGSRNERLDIAGMSHLLEHMQFKGTRTFKKGEIDKLIRENGGLSNAATWRDFTYYWETLSSDKLELAMRIESDRMQNSLLDPKELESERIVVRSELEGDENDPDEMTYDTLYQTAYAAHPYMWPVIGYKHSVETITREQMVNYYRTYYKPNNATVVIVGDFDTTKALAMVKKYFGSISNGTKPPKVTAEEEPQIGERTAEVRKAGATYRTMIGHHVPAIGSPDNYPLDVIEVILSSGNSSRLYKNLVDKQLATSAWAGNGVSRDPDLFILGATARDGVKIEDVKAALLAQVDRLKVEPVSDEELQKAINQLEAQFVYTNDSVSSQGTQLGLFETMYSWKYLDTYLRNVRKVTKADIQRVAQKYLVQRNRTVVTFVPEGPAGAPGDAPGAPGRMPSYRKVDIGAEGSTLAKRSTLTPALSLKEEGVVGAPAERSTLTPALSLKGEGVGGALKEEGANGRVNAIKPTRVVLDNGLVVIIHENRSNPTIGIQGSINAGAYFDPQGKSGLAAVTADMLMKGTARRTAEQIAAEKDFLAIRMDTGAEVESAGFSGYALSKNFDKLLDLMSDVLRNPSFPASEFDKLKAQRLSGIKQEQDNPSALASRSFYGTVFPAGHPYHSLTVDEELANTSAMTRDDVASFYKQHYGPQGAILIVVGDVNTQEALAKIRQYFGDWKGSASAQKPRIPDTPLQGTIVKKVTPMPDKSQSDVMIGYAGGLKRSDPDFYAAMVMNFVLGGGGALGSRMGDVIRDQMGLVYNVYSTFDASLGAGAWYTGLGTNPKNVDKAVKTSIDQIRLMRDKGAKPEEIKEAIDYITGVFPVRLERNSSIASILWAAEFYGLGMDYIRNYQKLYRSVTLEQVNAAAKKYLHPDRYTLVIAGPYSETTGAKQ